MHTSPDAFLLLSLPQTSLTSGGRTENGTLDLEFVSMPIPDAPKSQDREVYLVLRLNSTEIALDPARVVKRADMPEFRTYTFSGTPSDPELIIRVMAPRSPTASDQEHMEKLSTFENIVEQYVEEFNGPAPPMPHPQVTPAPPAMKGGMGAAQGNHDLRGQLVMINEDTGEVIGEVERNFKIKEDPLMNSKGHEDDPVIIEVPEGTANQQQSGTALEAFARIVPPDQQNWITKGAGVMSHAISMTTNLLVTTITTASNHYVNNSTASPHHSAAVTPVASGSRSPMGGPPPLPPRAPPRALVFLTSEKTRKGLSTVHTMSGEAVKISGKTVNTIDGMIRRAMGAKPKRSKLLGQPGTPSMSTMAPPPVPARAPSPGGKSGVAPPPYNGTSEKAASYFPSTPGGPARQPSPIPPTVNGPPPLPPRYSNKEKILISAELILSTLDDSLHKIIDSSSSSITNVMGHKYGPEAAESSRLMTGMAKNVGLVYVDVRGIGRRALLRRAGKTFVKARISGNNPQAYPAATPHQ